MIAYMTMNWAIEKYVLRAESSADQLNNLEFAFTCTNELSRNEYYNSKEGRMHDTEAAEAATQGGSVRG